MQFRQALRDGSDPMYAPCTGATRGSIFWKAPRKYRDLGYQPTSVKIGSVGDDPLAIARTARKLTIEMVDRYAPKGYPEGTWAWLIDKYENDDISPFQSVKANTKQDYRDTNSYWMEHIGPARIKAMTFPEIKKMELSMKKNGKSLDFIKRKFSGMRRLTRYGSSLGYADARELAAVLGEVRFPGAPARNVMITREQVHAIVAEADRRGLHALSLVVQLDWTFMLRPVDTRGHWLDTDGTEGGIIRKGNKGKSDKRWQDGLTWDMFDADLTSFEKVISKTSKSIPEAMRFELPTELRTRLYLHGHGRRVGPVIISKTGKPYDEDALSRMFTRICAHLGLPEKLRLSDVRAGAISEARRMGADHFDLRDAAQHKNIATTDRYVRGRSESAAKVVQLRSGK